MYGQGFTNRLPGTRWVYINAQHPPFLWYEVIDSEVLGIDAPALEGTVTEIWLHTKVSVVAKKEKETQKLRVKFLTDDRPIVLETGIETVAAKSIITGIYLAGKDTGSITIVPKQGNTDKVVLVSVWSNDIQMFGKDIDEDEALKAILQWYPSKEFVPAMPQMQPTVEPPNEHYNRLLERLAELGASNEWREWAIGQVVKRKFTPATLTYDGAKQIYLFVKSKQN